MILMILRIVYAIGIVGAMFTGAPIFAAVFLILGAILFFTDGWPALIAYAVGGLVVAGIFGTLFN